MLELVKKSLFLGFGLATLTKEKLEKSLFLGFGLATLTKEKLEDLGREVARQAKLSESKAREFQSELTNRAEQARQALGAEIDRRVGRAFAKMGVARSKDATDLAARLAALERAVAELPKATDLTLLAARVERLEQGDGLPA
jgi:polyhydroxyalkanoate synthesis regulator phasin